MAHEAKGTGEKVSWDSFFFYLNRVNAVVFALVLIGFAWMAISEINRYPSDVLPFDEGPRFASEREKLNSIIGQAIDTKDGEIVAYYEADEDLERKELAGLVLVDSRTNETLTIASANGDYLVNFDFLFEQGEKGSPVIGYMAKVSDEEGFKQGKGDLIIGALPAMTKNRVAQDIEFVDLPQVRSDGHLGLIMWPNQDEAEVVAFRLADGAVIDRAKINVPRIDPDRVSQGPGKASNSGLLRKQKPRWVEEQELSF